MKEGPTLLCWCFLTHSAPPRSANGQTVVDHSCFMQCYHKCISEYACAAVIDGLGFVSQSYKWKNHFSEMKGDVGMALHQKEGEQVEIIDNPIPTSLFMRYAAVVLFVGTGDAILRTLVNVYIATPLKNKDVGIGLSMISCLSLGIYLFPFFLMK